MSNVRGRCSQSRWLRRRLRDDSSKDSVQERLFFETRSIRNCSRKERCDFAFGAVQAGRRFLCKRVFQLLGVRQSHSDMGFRNIWAGRSTRLDELLKAPLPTFEWQVPRCYPLLPKSCGF